MTFWIQHLIFRLFDFLTLDTWNKIFDILILIVDFWLLTLKFDMILLNCIGTIPIHFRWWILKNQKVQSQNGCKNVLQAKYWKKSILCIEREKECSNILHFSKPNFSLEFNNFLGKKYISSNVQLGKHCQRRNWPRPLVTLQKRGGKNDKKVLSMSKKNKELKFCKSWKSSFLF